MPSTGEPILSLHIMRSSSLPHDLFANAIHRQRYSTGNAGVREIVAFEWNFLCVNAALRAERSGVAGHSPTQESGAPCGWNFDSCVKRQVIDTVFLGWLDIFRCLFLFKISLYSRYDTGHYFFRNSVFHLWMGSLYRASFYLLCCNSGYLYNESLSGLTRARLGWETSER